MGYLARILMLMLGCAIGWPQRCVCAADHVSVIVAAAPAHVCCSHHGAPNQAALPVSHAPKSTDETPCHNPGGVCCLPASSVAPAPAATQFEPDTTASIPVALWEVTPPTFELGAEVTPVLRPPEIARRILYCVWRC